jgi:hypothetical protein
MTKRNFAAGATRGNKINPEKPRGLSGATYGPAGPVKHLDPNKFRDPPPTHSTIALAYARYVAEQRRAGRKPLLPNQWKGART